MEVKQYRFPIGTCVNLRSPAFRIVRVYRATDWHLCLTLPFRRIIDIDWLRRRKK
jgi:hypothetical protein